jgi:methionyl aminopeptidase
LPLDCRCSLALPTRRRGCISREVSALVGRKPEELVLMRRAGKVVAEMHDRIRAALRPGVSTIELDTIGREVLASRGATSNFLGYHGYPAVICASPNDVIVHGIPNERPLDEGDIVSIDCGAIVDGWHGDAAFTAGIGSITPEAKRLIQTVEASLAAAIDAVVKGNRIGDIGAAVERVATKGRYGIVREYVGHGIGTRMHEPPDIPNYGRPGTGPLLREGVTLAIEPMLTTGEEETFLQEDGWTVVTADGSLAAHVEHTVVVTDDGPEILTV